LRIHLSGRGDEAMVSASYWYEIRKGTSDAAMNPLCKSAKLQS
jgi:hypothetical protein